MRPDDLDLDEEIRAHLEIAIRERIDRGEDPHSARLAAQKELGYIGTVRDSVHRVWYGRWYDASASLLNEMRISLRSLLRTKGLAATVVVTLALGIGANAAIFSVVRAVLLRPLVNRDADRLVYIRQNAPGIGEENIVFSVPDIRDFQSRSKAIAAFGDFSTVEFTMTDLGDEPRNIRAGVVGGSFFEVMGLRPVLGRLITPQDDGPGKAGVAVLTHRFWTTAFHSDPKIVGRTIHLGPSVATVIGVLEPSIPYPAETEIIANVSTSPHHLGATMVTSRTHRMTELFGRLAPGTSLEAAKTELTAIHTAVVREHPEAYAATARVQLVVRRFADQVVAPARTILLVLFGAAGIVFVIACSNVTTLILARSVRREAELAIRAALGASRGALRRTLLAESLVLCGAGAVLGLALARPLVAVVARYASRFSARALEVTVDASLLWVGAGLAMAAAVLLAFVPRLPSAQAPAALAVGGARLTPGTNRRLRVFATVQIAFSFVLLAGAAALVTALVALQTAPTRFNLRQVVALDLPSPALGFGFEKVADLSLELTRRIGELPGVQGVAASNFVPWRDSGTFGAFQFTAEGYTRANGEDWPHARIRMVTPGFFAVLGVPLLAGRDFTDADRAENDPVVIVSESIAQRLFPSRDALNRRVAWTDSGPPFCKTPCRIVGVVADVDDVNVVPGPAMTIYHPLRQAPVAGRLFVHTNGDPYAIVPEVTRMVHQMAADQAVERAATLADVRAEVLAPDRVNTLVVTGFAGVALLIAIVGVAGVLAFSVSARTREFGVRLAIGATPRQLLRCVLREGAQIVGIGIAAGAAGGYAFASIAGSIIREARVPGALPLLGAASILAAAGLLASLLPAARASRVDVVQALRSE